MSYCVFSDVDKPHRADGYTVEAVLAPLSSLPQGSYISWAMCEKDLTPAMLTPGRYMVTLHIMEESK